MEWGPQQKSALSKINSWYKSRSKPYFVMNGYAGCGKEQPVSCKLQTPTGPIKMGDVKIGTKLIGKNGKSITVTGVFPQGIKQSYLIKFRDGSSTYCGADHLWAVTDSKDERLNRPIKIKTTDQLIRAGVTKTSGDFRYKIPLCSPVEFEVSHPHEFHPYIIGALIGDGSIAHGTPDLCAPDDFIADKVISLLPCKMEATKRFCDSVPHYVIKDNTHHNSNRLTSFIKSVGLNVLSGQKFIPHQYLYGTIEDRLEMLRALMDTDGTVSNNRTSFSTSSPKLASDITTLVQSLGGTAISHTHDRGEKGIEISVNVKMFVNPFSLPRKAEKWKFSTKNPPSRYIVSIEPHKLEEQQCISVSADDNLYLTDEFIVTHNTTLARHIAENIDGTVLFVAFTGKAAYVLKKSGCDNVSTVHRLIYQTKEKGQTRLNLLMAEVLRLKADPKTPKENIILAERRVAEEKHNLNRPKFTLNLASEITKAALVIVDEHSMIDTVMGSDIMSFGVPILAMGDPGQLPPVFGKPFFTNDPDVMLTDIRRQALDSPIIWMSNEVREGRNLKPGRYGESEVVHVSQISKEERAKIVMDADQLLVGKNDTRRSANNRIRELKGIKNLLPVDGDRLICLRNNYDSDLINGQLWTSVGDSEDDGDFVILKVRDDENRITDVLSHKDYFLGDTPEPWTKKDAEEFDYGYAITVHKSQGSQWDHVALFDEWTRENRKEWLYTGITRAAEKVKIVSFS